MLTSHDYQSDRLFPRVLKRSRRFFWIWVLRILAVTALLGLVMEYGYAEPLIRRDYLHDVQAGVVLFYLAYRLIRALPRPDRWRRLARVTEDNLFFGALGLLLVLWHLEERFFAGAVPTNVWVGLAQSILVIRLGFEFLSWPLQFAQTGFHPARTLVIGFAALIVFGTLLLMLPRAAAPGGAVEGSPSFGIRLLNCLFTATSATCVTGLTVYDTGADFSRFGQCVILALIQSGGLGIMLFSTLLGQFAGRGLSLRQSLAMQSALGDAALGELKSMVRFIIVSTLVVEAIGAAILYPMSHDQGLSTPDRVFYSVFHSVSAFCNAGFGLHSDNLVRFRAHPSIYLGVIPLIVIGGIGFPVIFDLWRYLHWRLARATARFRGIRLGAPQPSHRFSLHSRLALTTTAMLIVVGTGALYLTESLLGPTPLHAIPATAAPDHAGATNEDGMASDAGAAEASQAGEVPSEPVISATHAIRDDAPGFRVLSCLFRSVTCRTAGFNISATDLESNSVAGHFVACILMYIGGSPGSTAGGIKTVTLAVVILAFWATMRGGQRVDVWGRNLSEDVVRRAGVLIFSFSGLCGLLCLMLCMTEKADLRAILFETISACGTVGLTTGLTPELSTLGRLLISAGMFAGRVGPLTVMIALAGGSRPASYQYPAGHVALG